jgi:hypothetical protein
VERGIYSVKAWGAPVGQGASDPVYCTLEGIAKRNTEYLPYQIANEYICGRLGMMLGLPMPPGVLIDMDDGTLGYLSLRVEKARPPDVIPEHLADDHPEITAAVLAYDCWIGNEDRFEQNLAYTREGVAPCLFDQGHALLGGHAGFPPVGTARLVERLNHPFVSGCLKPHITAAHLPYLKTWAGRIMDVPDWVVGGVCKDAQRMGLLDLSQLEAANNFLLLRRSTIYGKLKASLGKLPWEELL